MNDAELNRLEEIRQEILDKLKAKYGADKVQQVDDLGEAITMKMLEGEKLEGIEQWMYDLVNDFQSMLLSHHSIYFPPLN